MQSEISVGRGSELSADDRKLLMRELAAQPNWADARGRRGWLLAMGLPSGLVDSLSESLKLNGRASAAEVVAALEGVGELREQPGTTALEVLLKELEHADSLESAEVVERLPRKQRRSNKPHPSHGEPHTIGEYLHRAALEIDRTEQWHPVVSQCRTADGGLFLLHGPRRQNLAHFFQRVESYLPEECGQPHRFRAIRLRSGYAHPRSPEAWENQLRDGLGAVGTAEVLLREAARHQSLFLFFGQMPFGEDSLAEDELEALLAFLRGRLPELIAHVSGAGSPVRLLLATDYENEGGPLLARLDAAAYEGCERQNVYYRKLHPVEPLKWVDIESFLDSRQPRPPRHVYRKLEDAWRELDRGEMQFRDIVEFLLRELF